MTQFEEICPGLEIAQGVVCDEASAVNEQLSALPDIVWPTMRRYSGFSILGSSDIVFGEEPSVLMLRPLQVALIDLASNPIFESRKRATVNRYDPGIDGTFHTDYVFDFPVFVAGLSDLEDKSFEYIDYTEEGGEVVGIDFNAGDILRITNKDLLHRGKNPSDSFRYSTVLFNRYEDTK